MKVRRGADQCGRSGRSRSGQRGDLVWIPLLACSLLVACTAGPRTGGPAGAESRVPARTSVATTSGRPASSPPSASPAPSVTNPGGLSDAEMVGQLFVSYVYGATATSVTPAQRQANVDLTGVGTGAEIVRRWHLGGIILIDHNNLDPARPRLSTGNVQNAGQITRLTSGLQQAALADSKVSLLIGTDQEGGSVQRITNGVAWRPAQLELATLAPAAVRCSYQSLGRQLRALGINQDYAPVADVARTRGGVIGDRSFGPDPVVDSRLVQAAVAGLQAAGVLATLKHWPGHGSTSLDSHAVLPVLTESAAQWRAIDRLPFAGAAATAGAVMVGHLAWPALDPSGQPATLSSILIQRELRAGLGYDGLVLSDSLWMAPMRQAGTPGQVAVRAIQAGEDMLLETPDLPQAFSAVLNRLRSDPDFRVQVRNAVRRILAAKARAAQAATALGNC